ncbi:PAS domain-containing sensor histidine kinase [bacterium]|nr:MAG: PAS domain-containing sensor histidine kinase [bacterium]
MKEEEKSKDDISIELQSLRKSVRQLKVSLQEAEGRYHALTDTSLQGIVIVQGIPLRVVYASLPVAAMLGYSIEEVLSAAPDQIQHRMFGDDRPAYLKNYQDRVEGKAVPPRYEARVMRKDGEFRWLEIFASRIEYGGKPAVQAAFVDISERKRIEEALRESESKYRRIFENVQDVFYQVDKEGNIIDISPSVERYTDYKREELIGRPVSDVYVHPEDRVKLLAAIREKGEVIDYELHLKGKSGQSIFTSANAHVLFSEYGEPLGIEGSLRDVSERKKSEEALRASEERYRLVFFQSPVGIFYFDTDLHITDFNTQFEGILQSSRERLLGLDLRTIKDQRVLPAFHQAIAGKEGQYEGEYVATTSTAQIWVLMKTAPVYDERGRVKGGVGIVEDMTKRREAEREIFMLAQALKSIRDCVSITDMEDNVLFVNDAFAKTYGYSPDELLAKSVTIVRSASNPGKVIDEILPATLRGGWEGEILNRRKDGTEFPVYLSTSVVCDPDGAPIALIGAATDITERKLAEQRLRESEEQYRSLVDSARDVIFTATLHGVITSLNPAFELSTGWERSEWLGKTYNDLFHHEDMAGAKEIFLRALHGQPVPMLEIRIHMKEGGYVIGEFTITPQLQDGKIVGLLGVARDVTERKRLEDQYRQAQKMESLGTLAGGIAHDFNNILAIILGHASLLPRNQQSPVKQSASIDAIIKATNRGASLVSQLLTFASKSDVLFESVHMNDIVTETMKLVSETFPRSIVISKRLDPGLPPVVADATQLHQLLLNLCINARDAMPKGGSLSLVTTVVSGDTVIDRFPDAGAANYVVLQVSDTGEGMDLETKRRIFEPFFTTKEKGKGTGLGLATVYGIIESHGGFVDVDSEVTVGTTFHVYLPAQVNAGRETKIGSGATEVMPGGSETILVVEDEDMLRDLVKNVLTSKGYMVLTANDGVEGVEMYMLHRSEIALVVADVGLPRLAGSEVFLRLKRINPGVKVILASGFLEPGFTAEILKSGVREVMRKPYQPDELLRCIRRVLDT